MSTGSYSSEFGLLARLRDPVVDRADATRWRLPDLFFWFASGITAAAFSGRDDISDVGAWVRAFAGGGAGSVNSRLVVWRKRRGVVEWKRIAFLRWLELTPFSMFSPDSLLFPVSGELEGGVELHALLKQGFIVDESVLPDRELQVSPVGLLSTAVPAVRSGMSLIIGALQAALARILWIRTGLGQFDVKVAVGDAIASLLGYFRINLRSSPPSAIGDFTTSVISPIDRGLAQAGLRGLVAILDKGSVWSQPSQGELTWLEGFLRWTSDVPEGGFNVRIPRQLLGRIIKVSRERMSRDGWIESFISKAADEVAELAGGRGAETGIVVEFSEQMNLIDLYVLDRALGESLREVIAIFTPLSLLTSFPHLYQSANYREVTGRELRLGVGPLGVTCILSSGTDRWIHEKAVGWALRSLKERGYSNIVYWPNGSTLQVAVGRLVAERESATVLPPAAALGRFGEK